eukprot:11191373-Lingulodinium_polyedra.AAC.1
MQAAVQRIAAAVGAAGADWLVEAAPAPGPTFHFLAACLARFSSVVEMRFWYVVWSGQPPGSGAVW